MKDALRLTGIASQIGSQVVRVNINGVESEMTLSKYLAHEARTVMGVVATSAISLIKNNALKANDKNEITSNLEKVVTTK